MGDEGCDGAAETQDGREVSGVGESAQVKDSEMTKPAKPESQTSIIPIEDLKADPANARVHPDRNRSTIRGSLARFGAGRSLVLDGKNVVRAGNGTLQEAMSEGFSEVLVVEPKPGQLVAVRRPEWSDVEATGYSIADNQSAIQAEWNQDILAQTLEALRSEPEFDLDAVGFTSAEVDELLKGIGDGLIGAEKPADPAEVRKSLADRFGVPPFSVLDARQGYWQDRKRLWLSLGIQSELGRGGGC